MSIKNLTDGIKMYRIEDYLSFSVESAERCMEATETTKKLKDWLERNHFEVVFIGKREAIHCLKEMPMRVHGRE